MNPHRKHLSLTLAALALAGLLAPSVFAANTDVIITEVMYSAPGTEAGNEWVEIYNTTDSPIDLAGWCINDNYGDGTLTEANILSGTLPAGGTAVLYDGSSAMFPSDMQYLWGAGINFVPVSGALWPWLNDYGSERIGIWDSLASYDNRNWGNAVADLTYDQGAPWPERGYIDQGRSLHLTDIENPTSASAWALSTPGQTGIVESLAVMSSLGTNATANLGTVPAGTPTTSDLVITEIFYDTPGGNDEIYWECVEVYNNTGAEINFETTPWFIDDANSNVAADENGNITTGSIANGAVAVLHNSEVPSELLQDMWGDSINFIPVENWDQMQLNNSGDEIALWDSWADYDGDHQNHDNAAYKLQFEVDANGWPNRDYESSIWLTNLSSNPTDGSNWALSSTTDGVSSNPLAVEHQYGSPGALVSGEEPPLDGDLNDDGFVGGDDLDIVRSFWGQNVTAGDLLQGDPSGDGFVGGDDLDIVRGNWGQGTPPAPTAIPEPASLTLLVLGGLFSILAGRRRVVLG